MHYESDTSYETVCGKIASFEHDYSPENPRDWGNLGKLYIKGGDHVSVEEDHDFDSEFLVSYARSKDIEEIQLFLEQNFETEYSLEEIESLIEKAQREIAAILPVYRYDHGQVCYSTTPFSSSFDSGLTGYIYATKKDTIEAFGVKNCGIVVSKRAELIIKSEIETYSQWANGDVFGIKVFDSIEDYETGDDSDACWGFYFNEDGYSFADCLNSHFGLKLKINESKKEGVAA
ncbi:MAG: hypothetical protein JXR30_03455 [Alphaproteobacteria bacterium]|nr:hypothetical protein [Alphaproteobacteria bacterium]